MKDNDLHQAFLNTTYQVHVDDQTRVINLTTSNEWILDLLANESKGWCFITAWNPLPEILDKKENDSRNRILHDHLKKMGYKYHEGKGISEDGEWKEPSFLIVDINKVDAIELGAVCGQLAILVGEGSSKGNLQYIEYNHKSNLSSRLATELLDLDDSVNNRLFFNNVTNDMWDGISTSLNGDISIEALPYLNIAKTILDLEEEYEGLLCIIHKTNEGFHVSHAGMSETHTGSGYYEGPELESGHFDSVSEVLPYDTDYYATIHFNKNLYDGQAMTVHKTVEFNPRIIDTHLYLSTVDSISKLLDEKIKAFKYDDYPFIDMEVYIENGDCHYNGNYISSHATFIPIFINN